MITLPVDPSGKGGLSGAMPRLPCGMRSGKAPPEQTLGVQGSESRRHVEEISQREQTHKTLSVAVTDASRSSEEPRGAGAESGQPGRRRGPDL